MNGSLTSTFSHPSIRRAQFNVSQTHSVSHIRRLSKLHLSPARHLLVLTPPGDMLQQAEVTVQLPFGI
jgi:hypothetical protein